MSYIYIYLLLLTSFIVDEPLCYGPYLIIADPRHLHVIRESRFRPRDRRSVPADDLDVPRTVLDFRCLAVWSSGLAN